MVMHSFKHFSTGYKIIKVCIAILGTVGIVELTLSRPMFPSYRNQLVDLLYKSTDWFLYDGNNGR